jgi:hypothetical protein
MHYRKIWETHHKIKIPEGFEIHHIDGDRDNNLIENLKCVSIEEHLEIHKKQEDWGAVQAILARMDNKEGITEAASQFQKKLLEKNNHNFQKISKERRSEISKDVQRKRKTAFLNIKDTVENSRKAGKAAAEKKAGFLNVNSSDHGSKYVKNTSWWVNTDGNRKRSFESPGEGWKKGMKYES